MKTARLRNSLFHYWKNPHILASTIQSNRKYLSPCFRKLIQEGIDDGSIKTKYAKELSELLPLMELWMMPSVFPASDEEIKHKFEFLKNMFEKMGLPIFDENVVGILKTKNKNCRYDNFYFEYLHTDGMYVKEVIK